MPAIDDGDGRERGPRATWASTALLTAFAFLFATAKVHNFDLWWHLRTGEWILGNGRIPRVDAFSFTTGGEAWIAHYWLSDVLFALVHRLAGIDGLILLCAAVIAASVALVHRVMVRRGVDPLVAALVLGVAVVAARYRFMVRPHVFMFLFSAAFLAILDAGPGRSPKRLFALLGVMLLWVNMHGSFILALVFAGAFFAEDAVAWMRSRTSAQSVAVAFPTGLAMTLAALAALMLASPYGAALPAWVLRDFTSHAVTRSFELGEHMALAWGERPLIWGLLFATVGSFAVADRRSRLSDVLSAAALALLALRSVRFGALAALVFALVLGTNLAARLPVLTKERGPSGKGRLVHASSLVTLAFVGLAAFRATYTPDKVYRFGLGIMESRYPVAAASFLGSLGFEGNVLNTWEFGGYLLWNVPGARTFADGRTLDGHMDAVERTRTMTTAELDAYVESHDISAVMVKPGEAPYAGFAASTPLFRTVFFDDQATVFLRADLFERLAAERGLEAYRWIRPESYDVAYLETLAAAEHAGEVEGELRRAVSAAPHSFRPHYLLGVFLDARGEPEALDAFEAAVEANPALALTHYGLGMRAARLALRQGAWDRAAALASRSLAFGPSGEAHFVLGVAAQTGGRLQEAEEAYGDALALDPGNTGSMVNLGFVYLDSARPGLAVALFQRALERAPNDENALYGLALSQQRNGAVSGAVALWDLFLERFPGSRWEPNARRFRAQALGGVVP